jgi:hypothetical protein
MENKIRRKASQVFWLYLSLVLSITVITLAVIIFLTDKGWGEDVSTAERFFSMLFVAFILGSVPTAYLLCGAHAETFKRTVGFTIWSLEVWSHEKQMYEKHWRVHTTYEFDKFFMHKYLGVKTNGFVLEDEIESLNKWDRWDYPRLFRNEDEAMLSILKEVKSIKDKRGTESVIPYVNGVVGGFITVDSLLTADLDEKINKLEKKLNENTEADTSGQ